MRLFAAVDPALPIRRWLLLLLLLLSACTVIQASSSRDYTYYPDGLTNPLLRQPLYYNDAANVLADLDSFEALYIQYHSCAMYVSGKSLNDDGDADDNNNGGGGGDNEYWYMGSTPVPSAQVAYSLYGVKKGATTDGRFRRRNNNNTKAGGCQGHTYINSFYTSAGFTAFTGSLYLAGVDGFSNYAAEADGEEDGDGVISASCNGGYGVVCSAGGGFVYNQYAQINGDDDDGVTVCDANHLLTVVDELNDLNDAFQQTGCYQIYDSATATTKNDNGEQEQQDADEYNYSPVQLLLTYSTSCSPKDVAGACPDPFGILKRNGMTLVSALSTSSPASLYHRRLIKACVLFGVATLFLLSSLVTFSREIRKERMLRRKERAQRRKERRMKKKVERATEIRNIHINKRDDDDQATAASAVSSFIQQTIRSAGNRDDDYQATAASAVPSFIQQKIRSTGNFLPGQPAPKRKESFWRKPKTMFSRSRRRGLRSAGVVHNKNSVMELPRIVDTAGYMAPFVEAMMYDYEGQQAAASSDEYEVVHDAHSETIDLDDVKLMTEEDVIKTNSAAVHVHERQQTDLDSITSDEQQSASVDRDESGLQQPTSEKGMLTTVLGALWKSESICKPGNFLPENEKVIDLENAASCWGQTMMGSLPTSAAACASADLGKSLRDVAIANCNPDYCLPEDDEVIHQQKKTSRIRDSLPVPAGVDVRSCTDGIVKSCWDVAIDKENEPTENARKELPNDEPANSAFLDQNRTEKGMNTGSSCNRGVCHSENEAVIDHRKETSSWAQSNMGSMPTGVAACSLAHDLGKRFQLAAIPKENEAVIDHQKKQHSWAQTVIDSMQTGVEPCGLTDGLGKAFQHAAVPKEDEPASDDREETDVPEGALARSTPKSSLRSRLWSRVRTCTQDDFTEQNLNESVEASAHQDAPWAGTGLLADGVCEPPQSSDQKKDLAEAQRDKTSSPTFLTLKHYIARKGETSSSADLANPMEHNSPDFLEGKKPSRTTSPQMKGMPTDSVREQGRGGKQTDSSSMPLPQDGNVSEQVSLDQTLDLRSDNFCCQPFYGVPERGDDSVQDDESSFEKGLFPVAFSLPSNISSCQPIRSSVIDEQPPEQGFDTGSKRAVLGFPPLMSATKPSGNSPFQPHREVRGIWAKDDILPPESEAVFSRLSSPHLRKPVGVRSFLASRATFHQK